jgi:hypothetical protein
MEIKDQNKSAGAALTTPMDGTPITWISDQRNNNGMYIGGQTRADFFKSLRESAKSAFGALFADFFRRFADFLQTVFDVLQTFCRLYLIGKHFHAYFLQTFCASDYF